MRNKPVLVVMAAGMGSRYGGLKQLDPVGGHGQLLLDYSIYDARRAGFEQVVFVIKRQLAETFQAEVGARLARHVQVRYVFQELDDLPDGYAVPAGRSKPWGTAHAILAARRAVDGPFAVINADDFYGPQAFQAIYDYLSTHSDLPGPARYAMVGYRLGNTLTEHGHVARGVCREDGAHRLVSITEHTHIERAGDNARSTRDGGTSWLPLPGDAVVSMNLWGLTQDFFRQAWERFPAFLDQTLARDPEKGEFYLPGVIGQLIDEGLAQVQVLRSGERWFGVTYQADKPAVVAAIAEKTAAGLYPDRLWDG